MDEQGIRGTGNRRFVLGTIAGVLVGGVLVVGGLNLVQPRSSNMATPLPSKSPSVTVPAPSASVQSPVPSASLTPTPAPTVNAVVTSARRGSYIALFAWLPKSKYTAEQAAAYAAEHGKSRYTVVAIDGDAVGGLRSGSYGIGVTDLADWSDSKAVCAAMGFAANDQICWGRKVT